MNPILLILITVRSLSGNILQKLDEKTAFCHNVDIRELTISKAHQLFESNQLTPLKLTQCYLNRIKELNPYLNAVIETSFVALHEAKKLDKKIIRRKEKPLFGIPILIKDSIGTTDGMETTSGSKALLGVKPKREAAVVTALRRAGAIILGKTNLSELSGFLSFSAPEGWSTRGNQTMNPYVLNESPRGSSSGSAVAVATNLCVVALGTEADGAIHLPSMTNSVVGFKLTTHSISMRGIIPLVPSQEAVGIISRSIQDSRLVFKAFQQAKNSLNSPNVYVERKKNYRVGVTNFLPTNMTEEKFVGFKRMLKKLKSAGINLIEEPIFQHFEIDLLDELAIYAYEFKYYLNRYLKNEVIHTGNSKVKNFNELLYFYENSQCYSDLDLLKETNSTRGLKSKEYQKAKSVQSQAQQHILNYMKKHHIDAIIAPAFNRDSIRLSALAGFPSVSIPAGLDKEHPFSLFMYAPAWHDDVLFELGAIIESFGTLSRHAPKFIK